MTLEKVLSGILTLAAVAIAAVLVRNEVARSASLATPDSRSATRVLVGQPQLHSSQPRAGAAPVEIVVFADFECPACARFRVVQDSLRSVLNSRVQVRFVHYPLPYHRFAVQSATAAECAGSTGMFDAMAKLLFEKQDSIGLRSWGAFASEAGLPDTSGFSRCVKAGSFRAKIDSNKAVGDEVGVRFTPTVVVGGWRLNFVPTFDEVVAIVTALEVGRMPFDKNGNMVAEALAVEKSRQ